MYLERLSILLHLFNNLKNHEKDDFRAFALHLNRSAVSNF